MQNAVDTPEHGHSDVVDLSVHAAPHQSSNASTPPRRSSPGDAVGVIEGVEQGGEGNLVEASTREGWKLADAVTNPLSSVIQTFFS